MHLTCTRAQAIFPSEGLKLWNEKPLPLLWDCHHGDIFVLMVKGLAVEPFPGEVAAVPLTLEVSLSPYDEVLTKIETFAAHHSLPLSLWPSFPGQLQDPLVLAACHLPEARLFIFSETAVLTARATPEGNLRLSVAGAFKSRKVPCQETDLILHLERAASTRLLSFCFSLLREKR